MIGYVFCNISTICLCLVNVVVLFLWCSKMDDLSNLKYKRTFLKRGKRCRYMVK
ncbi:hypothetical protein IMSAGC020_01502 [Lachnospiraceae bacterium]|nr:hypothetical protein IMSAGC020_01502 [Lachnospiraceae bacterium]